MNLKLIDLKLVVFLYFLVLFVFFSCFFVLVKSYRKKKKFKADLITSFILLLYVNDMSQAVKCHLFLYADGSCLVCQHKDINEIEKQLNVDFCNISDWFVDN